MDSTGKVSFPGDSTKFCLDRATQEFRFAMSVINDEMEILLEDRKTKSQWRASKLSITSFTTTENVIPGVLLVDYALRFAEALERQGSALQLDMTNSPTCMLSRVHPDGSRQLSIQLTLQISSFRKSLKYFFNLNAVTLGKIDVMSFKLRDVVENVTQLSERVDEIGKKNPRSWNPRGQCCYKAAGINASGRIVTWKADEGHVSATAPCHLDQTGKTKIRIRDAGLYMISARILHVGTGKGDIEIIMNSAVVQTGASPTRTHPMVVATITVPLTAGDSIQVANLSSVPVDKHSTLVITRLM